MYDEFLDTLYEYSKFAKLGLTNIRNLTEVLGNPQNNFKSIHIAGTNGKGSTAAMIAQILMEDGYTTGLFTSPHLVDFRERIQVNREWIPEEDLLRIGNEIIDTVESGNPATFFEITSTIMFTYFAENDVDYAVIEVGLGGRLDATNIICPELSVITHVSMDHTSVLGDTREEIAYEKAGIIKQAPTVISDYDLYDFFSKICKKRGSTLYSLGKDLNYQKKRDTFDVHGIVDLQNLEIPLHGEHQLINATTAILTSHVLGISQNSIRNGLKNTKWGGRFEIINEDPLIILDGGHNPDGIQNTVKTMKTFDYNALYIVFGVLEDKEFEEMIGSLKSLEGEFIFTTPESKRASDPKNLLMYTEGTVIDDPNDAFEMAKKKAKKGDAILVTGSLYLVGNIKRAIQYK